MTRRDPDERPAATPDTRDDARDQRRAEALRANLKRRKAQLRGRAAAEQSEPDKTDPAQNPIKSP